MSESSNVINRPLYNSRIINTYIKLIRKKYSTVDIGELLRYAQMKPYEVADQGHWFTQEQVNLFHEKLVQLTGHKDISREAGRYSVSPESIGAMRQYILGMVGPAKTYEMIGNAAEKLTRSTTYESRKISSNKVEITVTPLEDVKEKPFQCENRMGFFEAISLAFGITRPKIEHLECCFNEANVCRYIISWEKTSAALWKRIRNFSFLFLSLAFSGYLFVDWIFTLVVFLPVSIIIALILMLISSIMDKKELRAGLSSLEDSKDKLLEQIAINYNNALMTNEIGQAISWQMNIEDVLKSVIQIFKKRLDFDRGMVLLTNEEKTRLVFRAGFGYSENILKYLKKTEFHLDWPGSKGVFVVSFREKKPFLVNDINLIEDNLSPRSVAFAKKLGAQSFICCPIICDGEAIGVLAVDNLKSKKPLVQSDLSLLMGVASVIGISIRNADLHNARERQFRSMLQVLAASIDARDPLTAGHSEKVTEYAMGICNELFLSKDYTEVIRVAASLHDYGKIGVPDALLLKKGRLTDEEYEVIKTHSLRTKEILEQINFQGRFSQVPVIASCHHEKMDGSGYPNGLKGNEIPLGSQIIAVADFFDAITSTRHYRDPMPLDEAFEMLKVRIGMHFDKEIVEAFVNYYVKSYNDQVLQKVSYM